MARIVNVNFKLDEDVKKKMECVCAELGLSMSAAFTVFARKVGREHRIPFEVSVTPAYSEKKLRNPGDTSEVDQLRVSPETGHVEIGGRELYCGNHLEVLVCNGLHGGVPEWVETHLELDADDNWYLAGLLGYQIDGLFAKVLP